MGKGSDVSVQFVVDTDVETAIENQNVIIPDSNYQGVDERRFRSLYTKKFESSEASEINTIYKSSNLDSEASTIWNKFFGNPNFISSYSEDNPIKYCLTESSSEIILNNLHLFENGIDIKHLPEGFFLNKDRLTGERNIIDYSAEVAKAFPRDDPLSVKLRSLKSAKVKPEDIPEPFNDSERQHWDSAKQNWYNVLLSKINKKSGESYCTERELFEAFKALSVQIEHFNLKYYPADQLVQAPFFQKDFNPITLISRWHEVMSNPDLRIADREAQWGALLSLDLTNAYGPIRVLTDHQNNHQPCSFVIPEMFKSVGQAYGNVVSNAELDYIRKENKRQLQALGKKEGFSVKDTPINTFESEEEFWLYLSFESKRNSIEFYHQAIAEIKAAHNGSLAIPELKILVSATTGENYSKEYDNLERGLDTWKLICHRTTLPALSDLNPKPNLAFLSSFVEFSEHASEKTMQGLLGKFVEGELNSPEFYQGARFYLVNGAWNSIGGKKYDVKQYIDLAYEVKRNAADLSAHISTFGITNSDQAQKISALLYKRREFPHNYFLDLFKHSNKNYTTEEISSLIKNLPTEKEGIIDYLTKTHADSFPEEFLENKKRELLNPGALTAREKSVIEVLKLPKEQAILLEKLEANLKRKIPVADFDDLNRVFGKLSKLFPTEFTDLLEKLASLDSNLLPSSTGQLMAFLETIIKNNSLDDFDQIYYRNQFIKCSDEFFIERVRIFIKIRSLSSIKGLTNQEGIELLATIALNAKLSNLENEAFPEKLNEQLGSLSQFLQEQPYLKKQVLNAINFIEPKNSEAYLTNLATFISSLRQISDLLGAWEDQSQTSVVFFNLLANFQTNPQQLCDLWENIEKLSTEKKNFILPLLNYFDKKSLEQLKYLIEAIESSENDPQFALLKEYCASPPYPSVAKLVSWLKDPDPKAFEREYTKFDKQPFVGRNLKNAFDLDLYKSKTRDFERQPEGLRVASDLFTPMLGKQLDASLKKNRELSVNELRSEFKRLQNLSASQKDGLTDAQKAELLCVCIEMLARTTAEKNGNSQELNTTQVMALYAMLTHPSEKLMSEIDTGEGKSRISMVLASCQVAQGKTVDFITSDMQLAERDYLQYNNFFTGLGIRTGLINADTPQKLYQKGGVNFSDASQLILARGRADLEKDYFAYMEQDPAKRCLLMDEFDKFRHDKSHDSFNIAKRSKELSGFVWIYPVLVDFIEEQSAGKESALVLNEELLKQFSNFVKTRTSPGEYSQFEKLNKNNQKQIITWLNSAQKALDMKEGIDYKLTAKDKLVTEKDSKGILRYTRKVVVLDNGRPGSGTYDDGVHQCLCAIQNKKLGKKDAFIIQPENLKQRVIYASSVLRKYTGGRIFGLSGTARSEAAVADENINYRAYAYLKIPRHNLLRRVDKNILGTKDGNQQIAFIKRSIREKLKQGYPILLICRDDRQSAWLERELQKDIELMELFKEGVQRVSADTEKEAEIKAVESAGKPGRLTISTAGMFGRGVDISASKLFGLCTFVPTKEDEIQIKGRGGRFGGEGEFRMILNLADEEDLLNGATYNLQKEVTALQDKRALKSSFEQEICEPFAEFLESVHEDFFKQMDTDPSFDLNTWETYLKTVQQNWNDHRQPLLAAIQKNDEKEFLKVFKEFTTACETEAQKIGLKDIKYDVDKGAGDAFKASRAYVDFYKNRINSLKAQSTYDVADAGQARVYSKLFAQTRALFSNEKEERRELFANTRAYREGRGVLFADLKAYLNGDRVLFANLRATIQSVIEKLKGVKEKEAIIEKTTEQEEKPEEGMSRRI